MRSVRPAALALDRRVMKIFFDGGCRPNPGKMEIAVVARGVTHYRPDVGRGSNNQAEWRALLFALEIARDLGETDLVLLGDSLLVVRQANGLLACRSVDLATCRAEFSIRAAAFARLRIRHIARTQNLAGIALGRMRRT